MQQVLELLKDKFENPSWYPPNKNNQLDNLFDCKPVMGKNTRNNTKGQETKMYYL